MNILRGKIIQSLLLITFLSLLAYTPLIPFLGFYSDDLFFAYLSHFFGFEGIMKSLIVDRPFNGYLLAFNYFLLGDNVFFWHIYIFFIKLLGGYALFFLLFRIWPKRLSAVTQITLLFLVYPGFLQQPLPLGFQNYITALSIWIISLFFTVEAIKSVKKIKIVVFTFAAIFLQINSFLQVEFFIGMEILRLLIVRHILRNEISLRVFKKSFYYYIPYILSLILFIIWRIFIFKSTRQTTDIGWVVQTYYLNPIWILKLPVEVFYSFISTTVLAYFLPIAINIIRLPLKASVTSLLLGATSAFTIHYYLKQTKERDVQTKKFGKSVFLIGLFSIFAALIPIIISGRFVRLFNVFDRYTITSIIGVAFLIVGLLFYKASKTIRNRTIILLVFLSVTSNLMNDYWHQVVWDKQKDLLWQLYWRSPQIAEKAMLVFYFPPVSDEIPFKEIINKVKWYRFYWVDYQIWAPGNLFFNYQESPETHFRGDFLQDHGIPEKIKNKTVEKIIDRNIEYTKDYKNTVILSSPGDNSCLWAFDKNIIEYPEYSENLLRSNSIYSDARELTSKHKAASSPPSLIFGKEPAHGWCYYFEKASLARQQKNWSELSKLTAEVLEKKMIPEDQNEWLPFIESLLIENRYDQAKSLIFSNSRNSLIFRENICSLTKRLKSKDFNIYCQNK